MQMEKFDFRGGKQFLNLFRSGLDQTSYGGAELCLLIAIGGGRTVVAVAATWNVPLTKILRT